MAAGGHILSSLPCTSSIGISSVANSLSHARWLTARSETTLAVVRSPIRRSHESAQPASIERSIIARSSGVLAIGVAVGAGGKGRGARECRIGLTMAPSTMGDVERRL